MSEIGAALKNDYVGLTKIDCDLKCDVPAGVVMTEVPRPRHKWSDVPTCPNCGRAFLVVNAREMRERRGAVTPTEGDRNAF